MNFFTRKYGTYKELIIKCGSATIESGLLDAREIHQIVADMQEAIDELLYEIKSAQPKEVDYDSLINSVKMQPVAQDAKDAEMLDWLEQQHWDEDELFELVNNWTTQDNKHHPAGLRQAIHHAMANQKGAA